MKFKSKDKVIVTKGFYAGRKGEILQRYSLFSYLVVFNDYIDDSNWPFDGDSFWPHKILSSRLEKID